MLGLNPEPLHTNCLPFARVKNNYVACHPLDLSSLDLGAWVGLGSGCLAGLDLLIRRLFGRSGRSEGFGGGSGLGWAWLVLGAPRRSGFRRLRGFEGLGG